MGWDTMGYDGLVVSCRVVFVWVGSVARFAPSHITFSHIRTFARSGSRVFVIRNTIALRLRLRLLALDGFG